MRNYARLSLGNLSLGKVLLKLENLVRDYAFKEVKLKLSSSLFELWSISEFKEEGTTK